MKKRKRRNEENEETKKKKRKNNCRDYVIVLANKESNCFTTKPCTVCVPVPPVRVEKRKRKRERHRETERIQNSGRKNLNFSRVCGTRRQQPEIGIMTKMSESESCVCKKRTDS